MRPHPLHRSLSRLACATVAVALVGAGCAGSDAGVSVGDAAIDTSPDSTAGATSAPGAEPPLTTPPTTQPRPPQTTDVEPGIGADGVGDELFPDLGNPGVDVRHYDIALTYDPRRDRIDATVTLDIAPTEARAELTLDAVGLDVRSVRVDGADAAFEIDDPELRIRPAGGVVPGSVISVEIAYSAEPDAAPSAAGLPSGWFDTDGGSYVLNEPDGTRTWLPSNDHPLDKATYDFAITVPTGTTAVANGRLVSSTDVEGMTTWVWQMADPMSTYLIQLLTGDYEIVESTTPAGLVLSHAVLREDRERMQPYFDITDDQLAFFEALIGPYPFDNYGLAFSDSFGGLAMEDQTRSLFSRDDFPGELGYGQHLLLAHELAHQWFGNAVSPGRWSDIWLNESFATYMQWLWLDDQGLLDLDEEAEANLRRRAGVHVTTGDPDAAELFGFGSYDGGAVVVHALRAEIGDHAFFALLRAWVSEGFGTSRTSEEFIALASDIAGRDLGAFFDDWLYASALPSAFPLSRV